MTKFSFEVPVAHLKDFEPHQDFTFALCFLLYSSKEYSKYIHDQCDRYAPVIIDNSFNETNIPIAPEEMAFLYREYCPQGGIGPKVISPDADWWSAAAVLTSFCQLVGRVPLPNIIGVFRDKTQRSLLEGQGCRNFAIPYEWRNGETYPNTHYLGLGDLQSLVAHPPQSLDTGIPIKMALRGERLEDWVQQGGAYTRRYPHETSLGRLTRVWDYFNTTLTDKQLELAVSNICALKGVINSDEMLKKRL